MAELASPESWCTGNGTVGSNPTPSAWGAVGAGRPSPSVSMAGLFRGGNLAQPLKRPFVEQCTALLVRPLRGGRNDLSEPTDFTN